MSILISNEEYKRFRILQDNYFFQQKRRSIENLDNLRYDVDTPILGIVAMLALLGCRPLFSCCGFDYKEQPCHKTHEYGNLYIAMEPTNKLIEIVKDLIEIGILFPKESKTDRWTMYNIKDRYYLEARFTNQWKQDGYPWANKSCIHFAELASIRIAEMERSLYEYRDEFLEEIILKDTNKTYKNLFHSWQYPILESWIIKRSDVIGEALHG